MPEKRRYSGAYVVPLLRDRTKNGDGAGEANAIGARFTRESVLRHCRHAQLKMEACGRFASALRMVRLQARAGCDRPGIVRDLRRLQLKAKACGQWAAALTALDLQWRFGGQGERASTSAPQRRAA